jgi:hypothetical protein
MLHRSSSSFGEYEPDDHTLEWLREEQERFDALDPEEQESELAHARDQWFAYLADQPDDENGQAA